MRSPRCDGCGAALSTMAKEHQVGDRPRYKKRAPAQRPHRHGHWHRDRSDRRHSAPHRLRRATVLTLAAGSFAVDLSKRTFISTRRGSSAVAPSARGRFLRPLAKPQRRRRPSRKKTSTYAHRPWWKKPFCRAPIGCGPSSRSTRAPAFAPSSRSRGSRRISHGRSTSRFARLSRRD